MVSNSVAQQNAALLSDDFKELTVDELKGSVPKQFSKHITQAFVDGFNKTIHDPKHRDFIKDNVLGYMHVLQTGKYAIGDYLNAVKFCSFVMAGYKNHEAYSLTFPDRMSRLRKEKSSSRDIEVFVSAYRRTKLVTLILEQCITPSWIINQDAYQEAVNVQVGLMRYAKSEKVRCDAANSLLQHLKRPETAKLQIDVTTNKTSELDQLEKAVRELSMQQQQALQNGTYNLKDIAESQIIDAECEEVPNER